MKSYIHRFFSRLFSSLYSRAVFVAILIPIITTSQGIGYWIPLSDQDLGGTNGAIMIWAGSKLVQWGGMQTNFPIQITGGSTFDPFTDTWQFMADTNINIGPYRPAAVWTGTEVALWGGSSWAQFYNTGGLYNPVSNTWRAMSNVNPPQARSGSSAFWTGNGILIYGGENNQRLNDVAFYDSTVDQWTPLSQSNPPGLRCDYSAVWTGSDLIVWGGKDCSYPDPVQYFADGKRYHLASQTWEPLSSFNAPSPRSGHLAVWTGKEMIIWGGQDSVGFLSDGASYDPNTDTWVKIPYNIPNTPSARIDSYGFWIGNEMLIFGGSGRIDGQYTEYNDGAIYDPVEKSWTPIASNASLDGIGDKIPVWTGNEMIVLGNRYISYRYYNRAGAILVIPKYFQYIPSVNY